MRERERGGGQGSKEGEREKKRGGEKNAVSGRYSLTPTVSSQRDSFTLKKCIPLFLSFDIVNGGGGEEGASRRTMLLLFTVAVCAYA